MNLFFRSFFLLSTLVLCLTATKGSAQEVDSSILTILRQKGDAFIECYEHDSVYYYVEQARRFAEENKYPVQQLEFTAKQRLALFRVFPNQVEVPSALFSEARPLTRQLLESGDSSLWIVSYLIEYSRIHTYKRQYSQAKKCLDEAFQAFPKSRSAPSKVKGELYLLKGEYFLNQNLSVDSVDKYLTLAQEQIQQEPKGLFLWYGLASSLENRKRNLYKAEEYALKHLFYSELTNNIEYRDLLIFNELSNIYIYMGDYDRALDYLRQARAGIRKSISLGFLYAQVGDYEEALNNLAIAKKRIFDKKGFLLNYLPMMHNVYGNVYLGLKQYDQAKESYQHILSSKKQNSYLDSLQYHSAMTNLLVETRQYEEALIELKAILAHKHKIRAYFNYLGFCYYHLCEVYSALGQSEKAMQAVNDGMEMISKLDSLSGQYMIPPMHQMTNPHTYYSLLYSKAHAYDHQYQFDPRKSYLDSSLIYYQKADEVIDTLRIHYQGEAVNRIISSSGFRTYFRSIKLCHQLFELTGDQQYMEKAFYFTERSKAYKLYQAVRESEARQFLNVPDSLLRAEHELIHQIQYLEKTIQKDYEAGQKLLETGKNDSLVVRRELMYVQLFQTKQAYQALVQRFETEFPDYFQQKYSRQTISLADLQAKCKKNKEGMLEYMYDDSTLIIFGISPDTIVFKQIPLSISLDSAVQALRTLLLTYPQQEDSSLAAPQTAHTDFSLLANLLYREILEPIMPVFQHIQSLTIIPDGSLGYLPFEVLLTEPPAYPGRFHSHAYLLRKFPISYSFSATLFMRIGGERFYLREPNVLAIRPGFPPSTKTYANLRTRRSDHFGPLRHSEEEVRFIANTFRARTLEDSSAVKPTIMNELANGEYRIIHFATHAKSHDHQPRKAKIAFSPSEDSLREDDFLTYAEIFNLRLNAEMIVLSACETGLGEFQKGEGIMSLARAFSYAGAQSVITTLWSVDDRSTSLLIQSFYQALKAGASKDQAMQMAKLTYIENHDDRFAHPFFWAGPIVIGDQAPIWRPANYALMLLIVSGLLLAGFFFFRKMRPHS
ncbi:MAG: CHAT domain-containing tetratricopeptide repeat protein [Bacteroidota bacterium]